MDKRIVEFLKSKGVHIEQPWNADEAIKLWANWYAGYVDGFHRYKLYQGEKRIPQERKTLKMAETACQDWADLLLNEKVEISCSDDTVQERLNMVLQRVNFAVQANQLLERAFAVGGGFFIEYWDGTGVNIKYVTQDRMIPITYTSAGLIEAAFTSKQVVDGQEYEYLETHTLNDKGEYVVDNFLLREKNGGLTEMPAAFLQLHNVAAKVETNSSTPRFQSVRPNKANKYASDSPFGVSVFSGAIDVLKAIDNEYDSLDNEFTLGRKRIFVTDGVANIHVNEDGTTSPAFDPMDTAFYRMPEQNDEDGIPIVESNMQLRIAEHEQALQTQLNILGQKCGFGENHYRWQQGTVTTATQVISENSKMFRTLKKHELLLRKSIVDMARSLMEIEYAYVDGTELPPDITFTVDFDDSIIEDTAEKKRMALTDYNAELISAQEYYRQVYSLDDQQAQAFAKQMQEERNAEQSWKNVEDEPPME